MSALRQKEIASSSPGQRGVVMIGYYGKDLTEDSATKNPSQQEPPLPVRMEGAPLLCPQLEIHSSDTFPALA